MWRVCRMGKDVDHGDVCMPVMDVLVGLEHHTAMLEGGRSVGRGALGLGRARVLA